MSIFGIIKCDDKVFTGDKLRIDVSESFLAPGLTFATVSHEVSLDGGVNYFNFSAKKYVDWMFSTAGAKTITLRVSTTEPASLTFTKSVTVLDLVTQKLFSDDSDLYQYEPEIDQYLPKRWSSWNLVHLKAQDWIIDWIDESRQRKSSGAKYTVDDIMDNKQVSQLSCYKALEFIYESNINVAGDLFSVKRDKYKSLVAVHANRNSLALDYNDNDIADVGENVDLFSGSLIRR